ncbi:28S ribosomal protein S22, mitochondrial [Coccinella septempunctata]|uniref:28S ribosomal protein S22, mitochondrial n=1 Tax=Coccinella septempunctata TaxID=41139 RepID=UPI001D0810BC|nr:28S ribosomal protein S22, mitochondrial [Coccinella septempunctata]
MAVLRQIIRLSGVTNSGQFNAFLKNYRFLSYVSKEYNETNDPRPHFFKSDVQNLLLKLTRSDLQKIFHKRGVGTLEDPKFEFLTDAQLKEQLDKMQKKAIQLLQFPPAVAVRKPLDRVLSSDPALIGYETSKIVFTDITFGLKNNERLIVVRDPNGQLHEADWNVRDRMNQVYFPQTHRQLKIPHLFIGEHFEDILNRKEYIFILDLACQQFEPDDKEYQRVTSITYQHIYDNNEFEKLRSTRHFGSMTFFLVWNKMIDNLLLDLIETCHIDEAKLLVELYGKINDVNFTQTNDDFGMIEEFIKNNSTKKAVLELALQSTKDFLKQKEIVEDGIKKAHGHS